MCIRDSDYILLEEMRDAAAFRLALDITSAGTHRSKATIHDNDGVNVPYKMACKIREQYGGEIKELIAQVFRNFDYAIELCQMPDNRSKKMMKGIIEYSYDSETDTVTAERICRYDFNQKRWLWNPAPRRAKLHKYPQQEKKILEMSCILTGLSGQGKLDERTVIHPAYYRRETGEGR